MEGRVSYLMRLITSMLIFGTIGIFVNYIPLPSGAIACARGIIGALCLLIFAKVSKTKISKKDIKDNLFLLVISGGAIGFNWIFLFEAYRYTTVANATLCYYMAPVIVTLLSPLVLKEKITLKKLLCILIALLGMFLVLGISTDKAPRFSELLGMIFGLCAAMLYATVILVNKKLGEISDHNRTLVQLAVAAIFVLPYTLLAEDISLEGFTSNSIFLVIFVGVVHTGIAYLLYFGSMKGLPAQIIAIFSYIDPVFAIILSALVLQQDITVNVVIGAVLILFSTFISSIETKKR